MALHHSALYVEILFNARMDTISTMTLLHGMTLPLSPHGTLMAQAWCIHGAPMALSKAFPWRYATPFVFLRGVPPYFSI